MGKERLRKKFGLGKNLFRKNTLGKKRGFGKASIALFDLGEKIASAKRGGGGEMKNLENIYLALKKNSPTYLYIAFVFFVFEFSVTHLYSFEARFYIEITNIIKKFGTTPPSDQASSSSSSTPESINKS